MASFIPPQIQDNPNGWGPNDPPDQFKDLPYAPFSKGDRLGKVHLAGYQLTRHTRISSHSQLVTSEHTTNPSAAGEVVSRNSAEHGHCRQEDMQEGVTENNDLKNSAPCADVSLCRRVSTCEMDPGAGQMKFDTVVSKFLFLKSHAVV